MSVCTRPILQKIDAFQSQGQHLLESLRIPLKNQDDLEDWTPHEVEMIISMDPVPPVPF